VTTLINDIAVTSTVVALVLDDYHVIRTARIHDALEFLLYHRPLQMQMVMATRKDPPMPFPRLRLRGQMILPSDATLNSFLIECIKEHLL